MSNMTDVNFFQIVEEDPCEITFNEHGLMFNNWDDGTSILMPWSKVWMFTGNTRKPYPTIAQAHTYIAAARAFLDELEHKLANDGAFIQDYCSDFDPPATWRGKS